MKEARIIQAINSLEKHGKRADRKVARLARLALAIEARIKKWQGDEGPSSTIDAFDEIVELAELSGRLV